MFKIVEPYLEPIDIFDKIGERKSELSDENLGFICGLIKERKPQKIVEVGVSAGGTTCVILNCLEELNMGSEVYSVDLSYSYHYDTSKKCGYQIEDAAQYLSNMKNHRLFLGRNIAQVIDNEIGYGIDMLILDTIHYLPGELLDFLVCLPYLSQQAVVILDDLTFAYGGENTNAIATKILFDLLVGDKVFPKNSDVIPKMAATILNDDTWKYVSDYFFGLSTPWFYDLASQEIGMYRKIVETKYNLGELALFDEAIRLNKQMLKRKARIKEEIENIINICVGGGKIYWYMERDRGAQH